MKALTLTQPWAQLVALGAKRIETRSWETAYRGPLAIHAGAGLAGMRQAEFRALCQREPFYSALAEPGKPAALRVVGPLPRGAVVAICDLFTITSTQMILITSAHGRVFRRDRADTGQGETWQITPDELAFGDYSNGRRAWMLTNVQRLPEPIPARGALGLWEWTPPAGLLEQLGVKA